MIDPKPVRQSIAVIIAVVIFLALLIGFGTAALVL